MGVDIILRSAIPKPKWLARFGTPPSLLDKIAESAAWFAAERGLRPFFLVAEHSDSNLALVFHPAEQAAQFSLGNNEIAVAARTSNGGPGYHVYIVDVLRHLENQCGLNWVDDTEAGEVDETNYLRSGDFQDVTQQMDGWLRLNLKHVSEMDEEYKSVAIGIPTRLICSDFESGHVQTVHGPIGFRKLADAVGLDNAEFRAFADDFYVWPTPETDLAFWQRTTNALLWCDVPWRPPTSDDDKWTYDAARYALEQFKRAGGDTELFKVEEAEIAQMVSSGTGEQLPLPFPDGRGYRRRRLTRPLQDYWTIEIPGHWYLEQTEDDAAYWYSNMTVRSVLKFVTSDTGRPATELLTEIVHDEALERSKKLEIQRIADDGFIGFVEAVEETGDANFALLGRYANDNAILIVSCYFDDEAETAMAWDYLRSVKYTGPPSDMLFVDEDGPVERKLN